MEEWFDLRKLRYRVHHVFLCSLGAVWSNGLTGGTYMMGSIMYFSILLTAALKIVLNKHLIKI